MTSHEHYEAEEPLAADPSLAATAWVLPNLGVTHKPGSGSKNLNMPREIKESCWKILRRLHPLALERFCERVLAEIERVTHGNDRSFHQRYFDTFRIVEQRDREMERIFDDPKRSTALTMLAQWRANGLLTEDEFSSLSPETRSALELLLGIGSVSP